ncbi:MAG: enoyl-CoA hydratase family protein [Ideonella sp.]
MTSAESEQHTAEGVQIFTDGAVMRLVLDNPAQRNALRPAMSRALAAALRDVAAEPGCRSIVLHGAGGSFCSGGDVRAIAEHQEKPPSKQFERIAALHELMRAIRTCPRPVIAAVEGHAAGAGASIALACDLIVAAQDAQFAISHVKLGISPDGGATLMLPRSVPMQLASEWLLQGLPIAASRLHAAGLVNRLCAPGEAVTEAMRWATELAEGPPDAMASIKQLVNEACLPDLDRHLEHERQGFVRTMFGADARARVQRFFERKRS